MCRVKRELCNEPIITISHNGILVQGVVKNELLTIIGTIMNSTDVGFTHNGIAKNFVFDTQNGSFTSTVTLDEGINNFSIQASNNCGDVSQSISATYKPVIVLLPPTVDITDPSVSPHETSLPNKTIIATVTNIASAAEISVTNNGANTAFNFDASTGIVTFSASLIEGANLVVITAVNTDGTASDNTQIIYTKPVVIKPPVVQITNPSVSPFITSAGTYQFTGSAEHLDNPGQLEIYLNGQPFPNVLTNVSNGLLNFTVPVVLNSSQPSYELIAIATNTAGSDQDNASIELEVEIDTVVTNCLSVVTAQFMGKHQRTFVSSDMDLTNVVLQFSDGTTQKFDGLSGMTGAFAGTGAHVGKCITGIWVLSGCNESGDGPDYGEWIPNSSYDGSCETTPCTPPTMSIMSGNSVTNANYNLQVVVNNATANNISVLLNGAVVNANYNTVNQLLSAPLTLIQGANEIVITANECEIVTQTITVNYTVPCKAVSYSLAFPAQTASNVSDAVISSLNLTVFNVVNTGVTATVNGVSTNFVLVGNNLSVPNINLTPGDNSIIITLSNACSNETIAYDIHYDAPAGPCGTRINPGSSEDWQFCLVTPSGTYNRSDLAANPNFTYSGPASSVYFLPIAGGGNVTVNGSPFAVDNGTYYLFQGNVTVTVSSNQPGAMGHWTVCLETDQLPSSGKGNNRPQSPCETGKALQNGGTGGAINGTPINRTKQPITRPKTTTPIAPKGNKTPAPTSGANGKAGTTTQQTRQTRGITVPVKAKEKEQPTATPEGKVSEPIQKPVGGRRPN